MIQHALSMPRSALWAGMGMGKTSSSLTVEAELQRVEAGPALVLAPLRVAKSTWPREVEKWEHLRDLHVVPIVGEIGERKAALARLKSSHANVFTMNYENLPWLVEELGTQRWPFRRVYADESTRLKNFRLKQGGRRAQALGRVAHAQVDRWVNLTGTPSPNGLKDLWGQTWFLDAGVRLGRTWTAFLQRWFQKSHDGFGVMPLQHAQEQIHAALRDLCITLAPEDYFDIEKPVVRPVYVDLPSKVRMKYREMEKEMFTTIERSEVEAFNAAARTMKCLQLASGAVWLNPEEDNPREWREVHDQKLQALESIVEEANGESILVSYQWVPSRERILKAFPKARVLDDNPKTEDDWNAGKIPMLIAHPASCGHGLNLQDGGRILVRMDQWWAMEEHDQILERVGPVRQAQSGHPRSVFVYPIIARDTVDEDVMLRHESKREVQTLLLEAMKRRKP